MLGATIAVAGFGVPDKLLTADHSNVWWNILVLALTAWQNFGYMVWHKIHLMCSLNDRALMCQCLKSFKGPINKFLGRSRTNIEN